LLLVLAVTALAGTILWTWARPRRPVTTHNEVLSIVAVTRIQSLSPHEHVQGSTVLRARFIQALWEGLVELDPQTLTPRAAVAESWEIAPDNRSAIFHLRTSARWSNGDPLIADDFVFALRQAVAAPSPTGDALRILRNAQAYRDGAVTDLREVGATALDAHTLRLDLEHPVPGLLMELCDMSWLPLHAGSYELLRSRAFLQEPERLVTNGAFRLASVTPDKLTLSPNPYYYARSQVRLAGVELQYTEDISLYPHLLQSGAVQMTDRLTSGSMKLPTWPEIQLWRDPTLIGGYIHFNLKKDSPLSDVRVRRALSLALDRDALVNTISPADLRPAHSCLPPITEWENVRTVEENLDEARRLLAEAGYPDGKGFPVLNWPYRYTTLDAAVRLPEVCAVQWRERLGIPVYLVLANDPEFQARVAARDYDLVLMPWYGALPDLARLASQLAEPATCIYSGWDGGNLADLVQTARQHTGVEERESVLAVEKAFLEHMAATPVIFYNRHTLKHRSVAGWYPDPMGLHPLKYLYFDHAPEGAHAR
jgi:oligopeptide transport system substrate-binding protein